MIAFARPSDALEWCLMLQELLMEVGTGGQGWLCVSMGGNTKAAMFLATRGIGCRTGRLQAPWSTASCD